MDEKDAFTEYTELFVTSRYIFSSHTKTVDIYHYTYDEISKIKQFEIKDIEDVKKFQEEFQNIFQNFKSVTLNNYIHFKDIEEHSSRLSFTPKNRLTGDKKNQFLTIETVPNLIETLYSHLQTLEKISFDDFKTQIQRIKIIVDDTYEQNTDSYTSINLEISQCGTELEKALEKSQFFHKEIEIQKKGIEKNSKKLARLNLKVKNKEEKISKLKFQSKEIENKEKLLDIKAKQLLAKKKNNELLISKPLLLLSFGFLYYSSLNSYSNQFSNIKKKDISNQIKKEKISNQIEKISFEIEEINYEINKITSKYNEENISNLNEKISKNEAKINDLTEKKSNLKSKYNSLINENLSLEPLLSTIITQEINLFIEKISNSINEIQSYYDYISSNEEISLKEGVYTFE